MTLTRKAPSQLHFTDWGNIVFGQALKILRRSQELNQAELAERLGVSRSYISELESGNRTPSFELLEKYAGVFDVPLSSLIFFAEGLKEPEALEGRLEKAKGVIAKKIIALLSVIEANASGAS